MGKMIPERKSCSRLFTRTSAHECCLVGFDEDMKGYRVYDPVTKISRSRDVKFINESDVGTPAQMVKSNKPMVIILDVEVEEAVSLSPCPDEVTDEHPIPEDGTTDPV